MALFKKTPENNVPPKVAVRPQSRSVQALPLPPAVAGGGVASRQATARHLMSPNYLGRRCEVSGKIHFEGPAEIEGQMDGEINAKDSVIIGKSAVVTAPIKARAIIVAGEVIGHISASQRIELEASAKVLGNLTAPVLVVHEGATFEGHCVIRPEGARGFGPIFDTKTGRLVEVAEAREIENGWKPS